MVFKNKENYNIDKIKNVNSSNFQLLTLDVFQHQSKWNPFYAHFLDLLHIDPQKIQQVSDIPFLPIQFFKNQEIKTGTWDEKMTFTSSGTTGKNSSQHFVFQPDFYLDNTQKGFEKFYGKLSNYCFLALLPAYLERTGSSLIYMADYFIQQSKYGQSGFFLNDLEKLSHTLKHCQEQQIPTILLGVSFALWDLAERYPMNLKDLIIMETGGMKGRRKEITRTELHDILTQAFGVRHIHSEYGMTELFSQAYSKGQGRFYPSPTMQVLARDITDPFGSPTVGKTGLLNIIDLANVDTCSFIATDDLGRVYEDGSFEILGRLDASDVRGCNLLLQEVL